MIRLRGVTWDHPRGYGPLMASADPYAEAFGVEVSWETRSLKDFGDAPIDALAADYDLLIIDHPHVGLAATSGCLLPLDGLLEPQTLQTLAAQSAGLSHQSYFYEGHQWALALDAAMQASAYRPDLLAEALPETWEDVLTFGKRLRDKGWYLGMPLVPTDAICSFLSLCANLGDPPGHGDGTLVSTEVGRLALNLLLEVRRLAHPDSLSWNPVLLLDKMGQGDALVYCPLTFPYSNYARVGYQEHLVRFHTIPGVKGAILGGTGFAVSARCPHPQAAARYGGWLCSAEVQRGFYVGHGGQPGNLAAWQDSAANDLTHNFFRDTLATLQGAYLRPRHDGFTTFQERAGKIIYRFLQEESSVAACFETLAELYRQSLAGRGL